MKRLILIAPVVVVAAACSSQPDSIQPGQWETSVRFTSVEVPGMPPAIAKQMQDQLANRTQTSTTCITPEQAANPAGGMMGQDNPQGCNFEEQTFSGGTIRVRGTCSQGGQQVRMSWEGSYTQTTMEGTMSSEVTGGPQNMRMSGTLNARRIGDCPAS